MRNQFSLLIFSIILISVIVGAISSKNCTISQSDYDSLYSFYNYSNGIYWNSSANKYQTPWNFNSNNLNAPCNVSNPWSGLTCIIIDDSNCNINEINLSNFNLTGFIHPNLFNINTLSKLKLDTNYIASSIPSTIGNLKNLIFLDFYKNEITGTIPIQLCNLVLLEAIHLDFNHFIGSIPHEFSQLNKLNFINLRNNNFTNKIFDMSNFKDLTYFELSNNQLTGSIPESIGNSSQLSLFFVTNNSLTGNIIDKFNYSNQLFLKNIDVSGNFISNSIPSDIFKLPNLETFAAYSNCLTGLIPIEVCSSTTLYALILDGMKTASTCRNYIWPQNFFINFPDSYYLSDFDQSIPSCLFNINTLKTLHLSGIGLSGVIENDVIINNNLQDLSLSNNRIIGSIPSTIQSRSFNSLDLGSNRLNGILSAGFDSENIHSPLYLNNNRLSGQVPKSLINYENINILVGNIFSCGLTSTNSLPTNDAAVIDYSCGSNNLFVAFSVVAILFLIVILFILKCRRRKNISTYRSKWNQKLNILLKAANIEEVSDMDLFTFYENMRSSLNPLARRSSVKFSESQRYSEQTKPNISMLTEYNNDKIEKKTNIELLCELSDGLWKFLSHFTLFLLLLWLPASIILRQFFSTYYYTYGFNWSIMFLSGKIPAFILVSILFISMIVIYFLLSNNLGNITRYEKILKKTSYVENLKIINNSRRFLILLVLILLFILNFIIIFGVNVIFIAASLEFRASTLLFIELFVAIFKIIWKTAVLPYFLSKIFIYFDKNQIHNKKTDHYIIGLLCFLTIVNNNIIPFIAVAFNSPNCFKNTLFLQETVQSSYVYYQCVSINVTNPSQCLDSYELNRFTTYQTPFSYSFQCSSSLVTTYSSIYIFMSMLLIIESLIVPLIKFIYSLTESGGYYYNLLNIIIPNKMRPLHAIDSDNDEDSIDYAFFDKRAFVVNIICNIAISVSIGIVLPLLGVVFCVNIYFFIHIKLFNMGDRLSQTTSDREFQLQKESFEIECNGLMEAVISYLNLFIIPLMGLFFSFFIYDTLGDEIGSKQAKWSLLLTLFLPVILLLFLPVYNKYEKFMISYNKTTFQEESTEQGIIMNIIQENS
jgi:Leucine-rich repeat (LRR) protein